jgi:hypothetical protein
MSALSSVFNNFLGSFCHFCFCLWTRSALQPGGLPISVRDR